MTMVNHGLTEWDARDLEARIARDNAVVFLGGTVGTNNWRDDLITAVTARGVNPAQLFNPVVDDWNDEAQRREDEIKTTARYVLFYIALPGTAGNEVSIYSLVELVLALMDDRDTGRDRTVAAFNTEGMSPHVAKHINKAVHDLRARFPHAAILDTRRDLEDWLVERLVERLA